MLKALVVTSSKVATNLTTVHIPTSVKQNSTFTKVHVEIFVRFDHFGLKNILELEHSLIQKQVVL